ncbi:hypothetical protein Tco_0013434 [Tanacetum coccineum]
MVAGNYKVHHIRKERLLMGHWPAGCRSLHNERLEVENDDYIALELSSHETDDVVDVVDIAEVADIAEIASIANELVPSCFVIYDFELLSLSFDFVFSSKIFKSLSFRLDRLCHLAILCLDQHA